MLAVSDTSPICYLILIDQISLLSELCNRVVIPQAVYEELLATGSPNSVQNWLQEKPTWLEVQKVRIFLDESLNFLDSGEREAIILAKQLQADLILVDERQGRQIALEKGLKVVGLLGILGTAANEGLINFPTVIADLQKTNFWVSPKLLKSLLEKYS